jgi:hypothetical protein
MTRFDCSVTFLKNNTLTDNTELYSNACDPLQPNGGHLKGPLKDRLTALLFSLWWLPVLSYVYFFQYLMTSLV